MKRKTIETAEAPAAVGPYSQAVRCGEWIFVSGQIPLEPGSAQVTEGGIGRQTERVLTSLGHILHAGGSSLGEVVKVTVYMTDLSKFAQMNEVYSRFFPPPAPARSAVGVSSLPKGAEIEIEAVARTGSGR